MSLVAIQMAMDLRMGLFAAGAVAAGHRAPLQAGGQVYEPKVGTPYYSARLSAYVSEPLGIGPNPVVRESGVYQVVIHRPASEGDRPAGIIAAALCAFFKRAQPVAAPPGATAASLQLPPIIIQSASELIPYTNDVWLNFPVQVRWFTGA
jgi:hypothetical protein